MPLPCSSGVASIPATPQMAGRNTIHVLSEKDVLGVPEWYLDILYKYNYILIILYIYIHVYPFYSPNLVAKNGASLCCERTSVWPLKSGIDKTRIGAVAMEECHFAAWSKKNKPTLRERKTPRRNKEHCCMTDMQNWQILVEAGVLRAGLGQHHLVFFLMFKLKCLAKFLLFKPLNQIGLPVTSMTTTTVSKFHKLPPPHLSSSQHKRDSRPQNTVSR
jgi:hypothetical protein